MSTPVTLQFTEQGIGTPLILLHGFPLSQATWRNQQQQLADQFRVITPDLRGFGKSEPTNDDFSMSFHARDILALLDALKLPSAAIMGHSMGGYVALALAQIAPERISALGLIGTQSNTDSPEVRQGRLRMVADVTANGSEVAAASMLRRFFPDGATNEELESIIEDVNRIMVATRATTIIKAQQGMAERLDLTSLLETFEFPVLIMTGDKDRIVPLERAELMASRLRNGSLVTIENAGHMMMLEQPQAVTMAIRQFMSEIISTTPTDAG